MTTTHKNPKWWTHEHDSSWDRVKAAFKRDWDQTKHDLGAKRPDTNQDVDNTVRQASGKEAIPPRGQPVYEDIEPAYRFGHGARSYYGKRYPTWNGDLEKELRRDWAESSDQDDWNTHVTYIRRGWDYKP